MSLSIRAIHLVFINRLAIKGMQKVLRNLLRSKLNSSIRIKLLRITQECTTMEEVVISSARTPRWMCNLTEVEQVLVKES